MQDFLKVYKDYKGGNKKLKAFAKKLEDIEDQYGDMLKELEEELEEQGGSYNPMFDNDTAEHLLCQNEFL